MKSEIENHPALTTAVLNWWRVGTAHNIHRAAMLTLVTDEELYAELSLLRDVFRFKEVLAR